MYFTFSDKPVEPENQTPLNLTVVKDQTGLRLSCRVTDANPNTGITFKWIKEGRENTTVSTSYLLIFTVFTEQDDGTYFCTATNAVGTSTLATIIVIVQCKYSIM